MIIKPITGVTVGLTSTLINNWSLSLFNVPVTVLGMAAAGSILSFAYDMEGGKKMTRKRLYFLAAANTVLAAAAVSLIPQWMGWTWMNQGLHGSFALLLAAVARFAIPAFLHLIPEIISRIFRLGKYRENAASYGGNEWESPRRNEDYNENTSDIENESK